MPSSSRFCEQLGDLRIVAVAVLELQGEALGKIACEHARRVEALQRRQHALDERRRGAELGGQILDAALQVACLVQHVDQVHADQLLDRVRHHQVQLLDQVVGERTPRRHELFQVGGLAGAVVGAGPHRRPAGLIALLAAVLVACGLRGCAVHLGVGVPVDLDGQGVAIALPGAVAIILAPLVAVGRIVDGAASSAGSGAVSSRSSKGLRSSSVSTNTHSSMLDS